jgi:hypothetical protein
MFYTLYAEGRHFDQQDTAFVAAEGEQGLPLSILRGRSLLNLRREVPAMIQ